ncbi:unnamed protein product, partial [Effrenium voratum]
DASFPASMKMWPWMRDLPSGLWAGRGLAYDKQNGLRRLSSAGGAEAMHDVQVWESVGAAGPPAAQPPTAAQSAAAKPGTVAVAAGDTRGNPSNAVKPARVLSKQQEKQSGVPGISWLAPQFSWQLKWTEKGKAGASARCYKRFSINSFMKEGLDEQRAEAAALEAAKHFRTDLVARGRIKEKVRDESRTSDVPGVEFEKGRKKWRVRVRKGGKRIEGGCFTEKSAAEACALELRELHGLQRTVKRCAAWAELPVIQPKVPFPGVGWHAPSQCWQGRTSGKSRKYCSFRPLDHSEAELEKAFAEAVAWLKKQQKEMQAREGAVAQIDKKGAARALQLLAQLTSRETAIPMADSDTELAKDEESDEALDARPKWELTPRQQLRVAQFRRLKGNAQLREKRPQEAFTFYKNALFMVEFDEDFEEADVALEEVHAERVKCLANLAAAALSALAETGDNPSEDNFAGKAKRYSQRALKLNPADARVWFRRGRAELLLGDPDAALRSFAEANRLSPQDPEVRRCLQEVQATVQSARTAQRQVERTMAKAAVAEAPKAAAKPAAPTEAKPPKSPEERAAEIEYNKRQLLYHVEKAKVKPQSDSE